MHRIDFESYLSPWGTQYCSNEIVICKKQTDQILFGKLKNKNFSFSLSVSKTHKKGALPLTFSNGPEYHQRYISLNPLDKSKNKQYFYILTKSADAIENKIGTGSFFVSVI